MKYATFSYAIVLILGFSVGLHADEVRNPSRVSTTGVLRWVKTGKHVRLGVSESRRGFVISVFTDEQAASWGKKLLYRVAEVREEYIVVRSAEPTQTSFGTLVVEKTIPLHAIAEVVRYIDPKMKK